jgi:sulfur relay (sulfurtransferase) DsrC/TusE family protein
VAENYKTIETEKELLMEKAHDQNWEFVRQEEKKNMIRLTEEEWRTVSEARDKNGKGVKMGWLSFKEKEGNAVELSEEEWKVIKDAKRKNKKRGWFFCIGDSCLVSSKPAFVWYSVFLLKFALGVFSFTKNCCLLRYSVGAEYKITLS